MIKRIIRLFQTTKTAESILTDIQSIRDKRDISLLLGDKILDVKILYGQEGINNWLDTSLTFIRLEQNGIICFPFSGDKDFENSGIEKNSKAISDKWKAIIYNSKIVDIFYILDEAMNFDDTQSAYIVLDNGYVLDENRMSPSGLNGADLFCRTTDEFEKEITDNGIKIYSVKNKKIK
ncbi:hypothetical protein ASE21_04775 [Flavobacterium sp. Root901]|uniref:hypothetical protein n=1 Tax=Flavobacterium sp. Root901 TaxID=1736605 RepID=UPI00070A55AC|nr:hypothetical protein [Flavobacterium sp. Root901]KRD11038.1 hypothetical protein ASE21_04775 [Flavobacterium sp. Root901]